MIDWGNVKNLQDEQLKLRLKLNDLLNSKNPPIDEVNALRADIKHLESKLQKILGKNERTRLEALKKKEKEAQEIANFLALKSRYKQICKLERACKEMLASIEVYNKDQELKSKSKIIEFKEVKQVTDFEIPYQYVKKAA